MKYELLTLNTSKKHYFFFLSNFLNILYRIVRDLYIIHSRILGNYNNCYSAFLIITFINKSDVFTLKRMNVLLMKRARDWSLITYYRSGSERFSVLFHQRVSIHMPHPRDTSVQTTFCDTLHLFQNRFLKNHLKYWYLNFWPCRSAKWCGIGLWARLRPERQDWAPHTGIGP